MSSEEAPIRVALVDDHAVLREGLAQLLDGEDGIEVVGTAADGAEVLEMVARADPDVVLMDLQMPGRNGAWATEELVRSGARAEVVVLTSFSDSDRIVSALDAGAVGYLLKDADPAELVAGVRAAARGESPLHPRAARQLLDVRSRPGSAPGSTGALTPRETEVLHCVRGGLTNRQIARRLGITERTVKAHLTAVYQRIGVLDRTQAALWAERHDV